MPVLGRTPRGRRLERIQRSPHYRAGAFQNLVRTEVTRKGASFLKMLREYRDRPVDTVPPAPVPSVRTDLRTLPAEGASLVWFGHSSYLLKIDGVHILVDPVFSGNASPFRFFAKAFPGSNVYGVEDMPDVIQAVLLTHDHYDHLDYKTILRLKDRVKHFYTSLGVGAHLEFWGIEAEKITELDWWEGCRIGPDGGPREGIAGDWDLRGGAAEGSGLREGAADGSGMREGIVGVSGLREGIAGVSGLREGIVGDGMLLTATPARHFSGRTFKRGGTVWSSFVLKTSGYSLFLGGDSGYEEHFKMIGERFGPFDLAILECGQYGVNWPYIHMLPEQTVLAARDLRAATLLPVHWGKFALSLHPWDEPIRRVVIAADRAGMPIATPRIGEVVRMGADCPGDRWYEGI
jgi:L-ascorbate metabolism protein UlaG (beta-lactamase superfamily)